MRTTISIPDEYAKTIKASLDKKGFNTLNEYILNLIRVDQQRFDVPVITEGQIAPLVHTPFHKKVTDRSSGEFEVTDTVSFAHTEEPSEWPSMYMGKPVSGRKATCPICHEETPVEFANAHYAKKHEDI